MSGLILPPAVKSIGLSVLDKRKPQSLLEAAQHNRRHPDGRGWKHKSDPAKIHLNQCLQGPDTCEGVVALQEAMMVGAGYTPRRKDYVQAFEVLFTTPANFTVDYSAYFAWCLEWTKDNLGRDILTADTHFDECADESGPHIHILMTPIRDGAWVGSKFTSKKTWEEEVQAKFGRDVEAAFDLKLLPKLKGKALTEAATAVNERLTELLTPHIEPAVLQEILKLARRKPGGLVGPLGIKRMPVNDGGTAFKRIAMSTGKGPKKERMEKPYGIDSNSYGIENDTKKSKPIVLYGFGGNTPPTEPWFDDDNQPLTSTPNADGEIAPPAHQALPDVDDTHNFDQLNEIALADTEAPFMGTTTRHRRRDDPGQDEPNVTRLHDDQDAGQWCAELGDFIRIEPSDRRVTPGTERHGAGRASRDRDDDQDNTADPDAFDQYNQPEVIDAWD